MILEDVISKIRRRLEQTRPEITAESAAVLEQVFKHIENIAQFAKDEFDKINSDDSLDDKAKSTARRKALEQAARKLEVLKARKIDPTLVTELEKKLERVPEKKDLAIVKYMQEREIRDRLYHLTETQILSCFGESLFSGNNPLLLDALLNSPPGFEMLSEKVLDNLRVVRAQKLNPEVAAKLETVQTRHSSIASILDLMKQELDRLRRKELPISVQKKTSKNR